MSVPKIIGKCIYCGTKEPALQREHVIPLGLNGELVLHQASCAECAKKTRRIEEAVLKEMFGPFRTAHNIRTRRPKKRPKSHPVPVKPLHGSERVLDVPIAEFPVTLCLPILPYARYLLRLLDSDDLEVHHWWLWRDEEKLKALSRKAGYPHATFTTGTYTASEFSQMLAKIAHGLAVEHFGIDGFKPLAINLALGHDDSVNYLVGSNRNREIPPPAEEGLHGWRFVRGTYNPDLIVAEIRLFASLGAPIYHVVVGIEQHSLKRRVVKLALRARKLIPRAPISRIKRFHGLIKSARKRRKRNRVG